MIVDEAEEELEMARDPFLEAGIDIPNELPPYKVKSTKDPTQIENLSTEETGKTPATPKPIKKNDKSNNHLEVLRDSLRSRLSSTRSNDTKSKNRESRDLAGDLSMKDVPCTISRQTNGNQLKPEDNYPSSSSVPNSFVNEDNTLIATPSQDKLTIEMEMNPNFVQDSTENLSENDNSDEVVNIRC